MTPGTRPEDECDAYSARIEKSLKLGETIMGCILHGIVCPKAMKDRPEGTPDQREIDVEKEAVLLKNLLDDLILDKSKLQEIAIYIRRAYDAGYHRGRKEIIDLCTRVHDEAARRARTEALLEAVKIPWGPNHAKEILALIDNEVKP